MEENRTKSLDLEGYQLWQEISNVVILEESMRQNDDQAFMDCLNFIREASFGMMTPNILEEFLETK